METEPRRAKERGGESVSVRGRRGESQKEVPCVCRACVKEKEKERKREGGREKEADKGRDNRREGKRQRGEGGGARKRSI